MKYIAPNVHCGFSRNHVLCFCLIRNAYFSADTCIFNFSRYSCNSRLCLSVVSLFLARRTRLSAKARTEMFSFSSLMLFVVSSNVPIMGSRIKLKSNGDSGSPFNSSQYVHWQDLIPAMYYDFATFVHVSLMRFGTPLIFNPLLIVLWGTVSKAFEVNYSYNST